MNTARSTPDVSANQGGRRTRLRTVLSRSASLVQARTVREAGRQRSQVTAPTASVWEGSWFSGSSSIRDLFYSVFLQPLVSVSALENLRCVGTHLTNTSTTVPSPQVPHHPLSFPAPAQVHASGVVLSFFVVPPTDPYSAHPTTRNRLTTTHQIRRAVTLPFGPLPIAASGYGSGAGLRSGTTDPGVSGKLRPHPTSTTSTIGGTFTRHVILTSTSPR